MITAVSQHNNLAATSARWRKADPRAASQVDVLSTGETKHCQKGPQTLPAYLVPIKPLQTRRLTLHDEYRQGGLVLLSAVGPCASLRGAVSGI